jgi:hypothetical protein
VPDRGRDAHRIQRDCTTPPCHEPIDRFAKLIDEASDRFAAPVRWIHAVLTIEAVVRRAIYLASCCDGSDATQAWHLDRYGLGLDPFDVIRLMLATT